MVVYANELNIFYFRTVVSTKKVDFEVVSLASGHIFLFCFTFVSRPDNYSVNLFVEGRLADNERNCELQTYNLYIIGFGPQIGV